MSLLVLRHEPFEHLGLFTELLNANHIPFVYHDLGDPMPALGHSGLVVLGGPMSANDSLPGLADELAMIERALDRGVPLLGICLGSQLIAKALGARVYRNGALEIGWETVHLTDAGRRDPVFQGIESPATFFHWHSETFDLPPGAEWLAWSEKTRYQAYRVGSSVYGVQFHPEVTAGMIEDWSREPVNCGDIAMLSRPIDARAHDQSGLARQIMENWLQTFR
ncbi:MAG TPA: type 1 glutamine amidotransferase [Bryobacteraceae bacterium]|nr:type 1 glutamine amidotransferase [Bryobacteraceae bacterium]